MGKKEKNNISFIIKIEYKTYYLHVAVSEFFFLNQLQEEILTPRRTYS